MLRWIGAPPRLEGFLYIPLLEALFGAFLMVVAVAIPILFVRFNGIQVKQHPEWFFCLGFLSFFLWMGCTLAFQSFSARFSEKKIKISHNLRGPNLVYECVLNEWTGVRQSEAVDDSKKPLKVIQMVASDGATEVYRSVDSSEIEEIKKALEILLKNKP